MSARTVKELHFTTPNEPGTLAKVTSVFAKNNINIYGICAYGDKNTNTGTFMIYTENTPTARTTVESLGYQANENDVIAFEIPNKTGALYTYADKLAQAGIEVHYTYCTTPANSNTALWILSTNDNAKAQTVLS